MWKNLLYFTFLLFLSKIFLLYIKKCSLIFSRISHFKHYFMVIGDIFYTIKPNTLFWKRHLIGACRRRWEISPWKPRLWFYLNDCNYPTFHNKMKQNLWSTFFYSINHLTTAQIHLWPFKTLCIINQTFTSYVLYFTFIDLHLFNAGFHLFSKSGIFLFQA